MSGIRRSVRTAALAAAACTLGLVLAVPTASGETRASLPDIEDEVMCTICGTLLAQSESPQAERERALIRKLIARGEDKEEIKDALVAQYGPRVLATPSGHGFDLLAWLVPGAVLVIALAAIALALRRARSRRRPVDTEREIDPADMARLDQDMSSYDT
jgi:cytochrome c-type biogenesis protein CcmH